MTAREPWFPALRRRLRYKRVRLNVHSPATQRLTEMMQEQIDREHRWVHRLEDRIAALTDPARLVVDCAAAANTAVREHVCAMCEHHPGETSEFCPCGCHHVWQRIYGDGLFPSIRGLRVALGDAESRAADSQSVPRP